MCRPGPGIRGTPPSVLHGVWGAGPGVGDVMGATAFAAWVTPSLQMREPGRTQTRPARPA